MHIRKTCTCTHLHMHIHIYMHACIESCMCVDTCASAYTYIHTYIHVCANACKHSSMCVCLRQHVSVGMLCPRCVTYTGLNLHTIWHVVISLEAFIIKSWTFGIIRILKNIFLTSDKMYVVAVHVLIFLLAIWVLTRCWNNAKYFSFSTTKVFGHVGPIFEICIRRFKRNK